MAKYLVSNTVPCYVTWQVEVEADSESTAIDRYKDGHGVRVSGPTVGESVDYATEDFEVELVDGKAA